MRHFFLVKLNLKEKFTRMGGGGGAARREEMGDICNASNNKNIFLKSEHHSNTFISEDKKQAHRFGSYTHSALIYKVHLGEGQGKRVPVFFLRTSYVPLC